MSSVKKPMTPRKGAAKNLGGSSCSSKKKQLSLMSFFKPAKLAAEDSSPLKGQQEKQEEKLKLDKLDSDKENQSGLFDEESTTDTPLTLETGVLVESSKKNGAAPDSSPVGKGYGEARKAPLNDVSNQVKDRQKSSPTAVRLLKTRRINYAESDHDNEDDDDGEGGKVTRKRRKIVDSDSESDDFRPSDNDQDASDDDMSDFVVDDDASEHSPAEEEEEDDDEDVVYSREAEKGLPRKKGKSSHHVEKTLKLASLSNIVKNGFSEKFHANSSYSATPAKTTKSKSKPSTSPPAKKSFAKENEERYQWLVNIKDAEKRTTDDPDYDSRTLYIPQSAWSKFTAFEKQYWEIKSKMWDTVVFFKKGKFYELYENDAAIANTEFDLKIAGGGRANMKLAGIPEMSFEYWAKEFISHGYKVAKVDQKETMLAKEMRGGSTKEEKIIKRELTGILTGGTLTDLNMISDEMAIYCMSIREESREDGLKAFGVAFVDTATSELNMIEFTDDNECTRLDTLVTQIKPKEVICEKNNLSSIATKVIKFSSHNTNQIWNNLNPVSEFWDYETTLESLIHAKYFPAENLDDFSNFPETLVKFKDDKKCAFVAFGGLLSYLKSLKLDETVLTLGNISEYAITKNGSSHLLLDGITLTNLEVLNNSFDGTDKGTLFRLINRAITPFGKRMLKHWLLHPLVKTKDIHARYDSIDFMMNGGIEFRIAIEKILTGLPDLERLLARIHAKTLKFKDFLKVIESLESISKLSSELLIDYKDVGALEKYILEFPSELPSLIQAWEDSFDRREAAQDVIVPMKGVDAQFDESNDKLEELEKELNNHLREYKKQYRSNEICYKDSGKEVYLIEVPNRIKNIPTDWQQMGSTSKVKRYWSPEVRKLARELLEQRETHKMVCESLRSRMYDKFNKHYPVWMATIKTLANIDCLISLAKTSESMGHPSCRPELIDSDQGCLDFKELRHPCFIGTRDFIPNDIALGGTEPNFGLLTGANAAGKSTIMRTTALAVILCQIGCYIPAESARISPIDKIMTRLGANDNIMQGKSTFFVELSETKKILRNATNKSLVILDELGRGGSSSDGFSIAEAVLHQLATHVQCLGFFATHFGSLGLSFQTHQKIKPLRMAILIDENTRNITFLYKLEHGTAPGSFGMNVALMCGISSTIVDEAEIAAKQYEQTSRIKKQADSQTESTATIPLGLQSDFSWLATRYNDLSQEVFQYDEAAKNMALHTIFNMIENI